VPTLQLDLGNHPLVTNLPGLPFQHFNQQDLVPPIPYLVILPLQLASQQEDCSGQHQLLLLGQLSQLLALELLHLPLALVFLFIVTSSLLKKSFPPINLKIRI